MAPCCGETRGKDHVLLGPPRLWWADCAAKTSTHHDAGVQGPPGAAQPWYSQLLELSQAIKYRRGELV